jgi:hypothetical protein
MPGSNPWGPLGKDAKNQCTAQVKEKIREDGTVRPAGRCRAVGIMGGTVCVSHGGSAPQVREAAKLRLFEAVDPVTAEMIRLALKAKNEMARIAAGKDVLDRAIGRAADKLVTTDEQGNDAPLTFSIKLVKPQDE